MKVWRVPYPKFGSQPALPRVKAIAERLDVDLTAFGLSGAAIVGSNGKGSTAAMVAALLQQTGERVGLFTSPHLYALNERFRLDDRDIGDDELEHHWRRVAAAAEAYLQVRQERFGAFEFLFLIAADWFAAANAYYTVWEAGIGGRLDPVRLIEAQCLALTSLDLEHTELLGDTLQAIAREKLDAAPRGARAFVGADCAVRPAIAAHCRERGVACAFVDGDALGALQSPLLGAHQRGNAALALSLARDLAALSDDHAAAGLSATRWPGRLEVLRHDPLLVIDVGHTPAAAASARAGFEALRGARPSTLVCGVSADKDASGVIGALAPGFDRILCTEARHKAAPADVVARHAREGNAQARIDIAASLDDARRAAMCGTHAVLVAGGLYLAAEFRALHLGRDLNGLRFL
jgi:dihydrofolate synthase/folylpolyglutamate synthase